MRNGFLRFKKKFFEIFDHLLYLQVSFSANDTCTNTRAPKILSVGLGLICWTILVNKSNEFQIFSIKFRAQETAWTKRSWHCFCTIAFNCRNYWAKWRHSAVRTSSRAFGVASNAIIIRMKWICNNFWIGWNANRNRSFGCRWCIGWRRPKLQNIRPNATFAKCFQLSDLGTE